MPGTGWSINPIVIASEMLAQAARQEIEINCVDMRNERQAWSSFENDMILHLKNPREFTEKQNSLSSSLT